MTDHLGPNRLMLDLETLSSKGNAVITSIGVARFTTKDGIVSRRLWALDYREDSGHIDPNTVRWWLEQDEQVRANNLLGAVPVHRALLELAPMIRVADELWANSPSFDCTILRAAYERYNLTPPWSYRIERDCRTMFAIGRQLGVGWPPNDSKHDAGADAVTQARYLLDIERALGIHRLKHGDTE